MAHDSITDQGFVFEQERRESAAAVYHQLRPGIVALREVALPFSGPLIEPASALAWLEADESAEDEQ